MRVLWLGMNDEDGCVLHWHKLRLELQKLGVTLAGPGYSWEFGQSHSLSEFGSDWDWIVLDDCNAMGYVPVRIDRRPSCKVAWREHDWHNKRRQAMASALEPDLVLACYDRPMETEWEDRFRSHPRFTVVPHAVDTATFHGDDRQRKYRIGMYGNGASCYPERQAARKVIAGMDRHWLPTHGGYWRDGRGSDPGVTFYNDDLAEALRDVEILYVSGGLWAGCVLKYFEGAASGCVLIGQRPHGCPFDDLIECEPEDIPEVVGSLGDTRHLSRSLEGRVKRDHALDVRAAEIMEVLRA